MQTQPITDQIANISPLWVVLIVTAFTLVRVALARASQPWARAVAETCDTINFVLILAFLLVRPFVAQAFYIPSASMRPTLLERDRLIVDKFSYRLHEPQRRDVVVFNAPPEASDEHVDGIDFIKRLVALPGDTIEVKAAALRLGDEVITWDGVSGVHDYLRGRLSLGDEAIKLFPEHVLVGGERKITKEELAKLLGIPGAPITITPGQTWVNGEVQDEPYTREDPTYDDGLRRLGPGKLFMLGDNRNQSRDSHIWGPLDRNRVVGRALFVFWPIPRVGPIR
jgi:signal peptidase I